MDVAYAFYDWEEGQYGDDVLLKTMYSLSGSHREAFEGWLMKNDFTDFAVLREEEEDRPAICGASAEIHFFRYN